jgi:hypothetical protein
MFSLLQESNYRDRARARDRKCLITGLQAYSRLKVVHIFPREHDDEVSGVFYHDS